MVRTNNQQRILEYALDLLAEHGSHGLTMRKVADRSGISLGNLQYYYKDREKLLMAMIDMYLNKCMTIIEMEFFRHLAEKPEIQLPDLQKFIASLIHSEELSEWCRIFREFWALSSRSLPIKNHLDYYYLQSATKLSQIFAKLTEDSAKIRRIELLLIPFIEGYSITSDALQASAEQTSQFISTIIWLILKEDLAADCIITPRSEPLIPG
ncbi:transcriptional regulator [Rheinheimera sp. A13L]|uniref:TetR/AcrR family transcriptional regulator n=1 Tax=Rheinheimera sp. A13L TaxID=506534 RepID=UPI000212542D|nr:TetR/AcrR family transcriptional regulator [Rheinheimera sp. A13L]EGM77232.1 transcriptional regulator [Rheinheimera sp. A13L]